MRKRDYRLGTMNEDLTNPTVDEISSVAAFPQSTLRTWISMRRRLGGICLRDRDMTN